MTGPPSGSLAYWSDKLARQFAPVSFPVDYVAGKEETREEALEFVVPEALCARLSKLSNESEQRLYMLLIAFVAGLLHRYTLAERLTVGMPLLRQGGAAVPGPRPCLPVTLETPGEGTFKELLLQVRQQFVEVYQHQAFYPDLVTGSAPGPGAGSAFFGIAVSLKEIHEPVTFAGSGLKLHFAFTKQGPGIWGSITYDRQHYRPETVAAIKRHLVRLWLRDRGRPFYNG